MKSSHNGIRRTAEQSLHYWPWSGIDGPLAPRIARADKQVYSEFEFSRRSTRQNG